MNPAFMLKGEEYKVFKFPTGEVQVVLTKYYPKRTKTTITGNVIDSLVDSGISDIHTTHNPYKLKHTRLNDV